MQFPDKPPPYSSLVVPHEQERPPTYSVSDNPPPALQISAQTDRYLQVGAIQNQVCDSLAN